MVVPPVFILGWYTPILRQCGYLWAPGPGPDPKEGGRGRTSRRWMGRMAPMGVQALLLTSTIVLLCHFVLTELASWNCITWASSLLVTKAVLRVAVPSSSPSSPFIPIVTCSQEGVGECGAGQAAGSQVALCMCRWASMGLSSRWWQKCLSNYSLHCSRAGLLEQTAGPHPQGSDSAGLGGDWDFTFLMLFGELVTFGNTVLLSTRSIAPV